MRSATRPQPQNLDKQQLDYYSRASNERAGRRSVLQHYIPPETAYAFPVNAHQIVRVTCCDGPQVGDLNAFSRTDAREHFWSGRTRTLHGSHVKIGDRLWSTEPKMRPMLTFITDTVEHTPLPFNARTHDLIYSRCSQRSRELLTGKRDQPNCNTNLERALQAADFSAAYVHDAFNIFMTTGYDDQQRLFYLPSAARKDDYVELYADIDTMVAISCCPSPCNGEGDETRGLAVEVFDLQFRPD
jgi:uncharacterized protein YcgI (DUF1989 family)